ncbi:hypothetical protein BLA29_010158, partial [Euroglyphus maynei]
ENVYVYSINITANKIGHHFQHKISPALYTKLVHDQVAYNAVFNLQAKSNKISIFTSSEYEYSVKIFYNGILNGQNLAVYTGRKNPNKKNGIVHFGIYYREKLPDIFLFVPFLRMADRLPDLRQHVMKYIFGNK